jgi:AraC-like DNA-binding protein
MRYPDGFVLETHSHAWNQLLYAAEGVMRVEARSGAWVVPPHRAVWLPALVDHHIVMRGSVAMRTVYFAPHVKTQLATTAVVNVSPLLRELVVHCTSLGRLDVRVPHEARLAALLVDLLDEVRAVPLKLPMPHDTRALDVATRVTRAPGDASTLRALAKGAGASPRTIERVFLAETGMTFGRWRQQARLLHALTLLAAGEPVTSVALDVGYVSLSAFIAMFKGSLGTTPSRFFGSSRTSYPGAAG